MTNENGRRLVRVLMGPANMVRTRPGDCCVSNDVPQYAEVRQVWYEPRTHEWTVLLEHESFAVVPEGAVVPVITGPIMQRLEPPLTVDVRELMERVAEERDHER